MDPSPLDANMKTGFTVRVEVTGLVVSGFGNGADTRNYKAICNNKGNTLRQKDGKTIHAYTG